jgi:hypothetical protein
VVSDQLGRRDLLAKPDLQDRLVDQVQLEQRVPVATREKLATPDHLDWPEQQEDLDQLVVPE